MKAMPDAELSAELSSELSSELSIEAFEAGRIDAERFDHEAHVYVAWLYVQQFELLEAIARFDAALQRFVVKNGATAKYHATLTWFFLFFIAERSDRGDCWTTFRRQNPELISNSRKLLSQHYDPKTLSSARARQRFVLPDTLMAWRSVDESCRRQSPEHTTRRPCPAQS